MNTQIKHNSIEEFDVFGENANGGGIERDGRQAGQWECSHAVVDKASSAEQ